MRSSRRHISVIEKLKKFEIRCYGRRSLLSVNRRGVFFRDVQEHTHTCHRP
jgi:hypothetical protein